MATRPITKEIATTTKDLDVFSGWLRRLENPDPVLATEASGKGLKLYDEVARDAHAGSVLQTRYLAVAGREWEVLPASDKRADTRAAELVREVLDAVNLSQALQELMQAVLYGFYVVEVMWTARDDRWVPRTLMGKHPRRFSFTLDRELRLLTPDNMIDGEPVPLRKFIVFTWGSADNPYGHGLGQKLWWPVWFKKHGIKFWLVFLEKFGMPTVVGKYPPSAPADQQEALLDAIDAIQQDTGIKIPETMALDLLEAARTGNPAYETMCEYMDRQVSKAVLGQTLTSGGESGGSYALGQVHDEVRQDILKADADVLCETLNATLVRWIVEYNLPGLDALPRLWLRTEAEQDLKELAERDKLILVDMGMAKRVPESYITDTYGIPLAAEGEAAMAAAQPAPAPPGDAAAAFAEVADATPVDPQTARLETEAAPAWQDLLARVQALVDGAENLPALREALLAAFDDLPADDLAEVMAMGFAAAELTGRYDVLQEGADG